MFGCGVWVFARAAVAAVTHCAPVFCPQKNAELRRLNAILARNISCLFKTAKEEIERTKLLSSIGTSPYTPQQAQRHARPSLSPSQQQPQQPQQQHRGSASHERPSPSQYQQQQQQSKRPGSTNDIDFNRIDEVARKRARNE